MKIQRDFLLLLTLVVAATPAVGQTNDSALAAAATPDFSGMGPDALACLNDADVPLADEVLPVLSEVQRLTPSIEALYVPSIDESLDEEDAKKAFWSSFRVLGEWYADLPPY